MVAAVIVWLEGEEAGEVVGLGWWWLDWGRKMSEGKGIEILLFNFPFYFCKGDFLS